MGHPRRKSSAIPTLSRCRPGTTAGQILAMGGMELVFLSAMPIALSSRLVGQWTSASAVPPDEWARAVRVVDAGFFHSPLGFRVGAPPGEPLFLRYQRDGEILGVALGVRSRCRLSGELRHAYFPTTPAYASEVDHTLANAALAQTLRDLGIAEVRWDSFDAASTVSPAPHPERVEYLLDLAQVDERLVWPPSAAHRRSVRRGEREGWTLKPLTGPARLRALEGVMERVIERASGRGVELHVAVPAVLSESGPEVEKELVVYAAKDGETLLAAALIGLSEHRAYFLMGGATLAGYQCGGSVWLHARLASELAARGMPTYNLGGAPASALKEDDPAHGLHRFKMGFGPAVVPCAGDHWVLGAGHVRGHQLLQWAKRWVA
jgi:hypothetical protein